MLNTFSITVLKVLRMIYAKCTGLKPFAKQECEQNPNKTAEFIYDALVADKPCMIARFGANELTCLRNYMGVRDQQGMYFEYIKGVAGPWWWEQNIIQNMQQGAGFFPARADKIEEFCELMIQDIPDVDVLGSWLADERLFSQALQHCKKVNFELLNPYFSKAPWTKALAGKKVLVVHPFARTIEQQYKKRELLFEDDLLPQFKLMTVQAVQSIAGNPTEFADWFAALDAMKAQIDKHDYDICLIGCGAYGFPLAAHVKRMGKKGFQLGGSLQLLFGISGKRWANPNYNSQYNYAELMNEHWVTPADAEKPTGAAQVEGACYW
jgi:hypothetical protein